MASEEPPAETSPDTLIPVQENLSFQGYLRKRKDTMKFNWAKYWFKLQNTTLYFYTNKDQPETSLRGQYYMFSVQSVRSLSDADGDFTFEIVMKNGKRKLLSAESAELRDVWVKILWKSMQLPGPGRYKSSCTWYDIPQLIKKFSFSSADKQVVVTDENNLKIGQPVVVTDENSLKIGQPVVVTDDLSEEPPGAVQTAGIDDGGPDAANVLPQFLCSAQPLYTGENSDQSSDDDIYDVPRPQAMNLTVYLERTAGEEEEQQRTAGEEQQRTAGEKEQQQRTAGEKEQQQLTAGEEQQQLTAGEEQQQLTAGEEQQQLTAGEEEEQQQRTAGEEEEKEQQRTAGEEEQQRTAGEEKQQRTAVSGLQLYDAPSSDAAHTDVSGVVLKASTEVPDISSPACVPESPAEESSPD